MLRHTYDLSDPFPLVTCQVLSARRVVGVEMNEQAVEDARANAELNGR